MKCCLCGNKIETVLGYSEGNNAQPLKNGRCCGRCNQTKVIPKRLRIHFQE